MLLIVNYVNVVEEYEESLIERAVPVRDLSMLLLWFGTPGSYLICSNPVNVRCGVMAIWMATVLSVGTIVTNKHDIA